jgi:hypothetical protein
MLLPFLCKAEATVAEVATSKAIHPLVFLPFHLASHHLTARTFANKRVSYPAHLALTLTQYTAEHFSAEFPSLAEYGALLVPVALSLVPYYYYRSFKHTTGSTRLVWAGLAVFVLALLTFKGLELGFPKDDPAEQAIANLDPTHSYWHLLVHVVFLINGILVSSYVPWNPPKDAIQEALPAVPSSPAHRTLRARGSALKSDCAPSPKQRGGGFTAWPAKPIKAA